MAPKTPSDFATIAAQFFTTCEACRPKEAPAPYWVTTYKLHAMQFAVINHGLIMAKCASGAIIHNGT